MDLFTFVRQLSEDGTLAALGSNPLAQFGTPNRTFLGATLLPERSVPQNVYKETAIRYRTVIANDGTRYSPAQLMNTGQLVGEFLVELGNQDIAQQLTSQDYDALLELLQSTATPEAIATMLQWVDRAVVLPLIEAIERQRWQAIVDAEVVRKGDNAYEETVEYPDPDDHRSVAGGTWSNDAYDPYEDIVAKADLLADKGFALSRVVTSRKVVSILTRNEQIARRFASVRVLSDADLFGRMSAAQLQSGLAADGLPQLEQYDLRYNTLEGVHRFIPDDVMIFFATTGRDEVISMEAEDEEDIFLPDTLGYTAIGRPAGKPNSGRALWVAAKDDKPPRVEAEGWQTSLPVITEPEAIAVITGIA